MGAIRIDELAIPETAGAAGWDDFAAASAVLNRAETKWFATPHRASSPEEDLPHFQDPHRPSRLFLARDDARVVGTGWIDTQQDDAATAWVYVTVDPDQEGRGIGRALMDAVEDAVRQTGHRKVIVYAPEFAMDGERRVPPTGHGSVPAASRSTRFMDARGYRLEQVNRVSELALPVEGVDAKLRAAVARSGPDFALHSWIGATPERWRAGIATLYTRMSTDPPDGGLETPEDVWDAQRIAEEDARKERDDPRRMVVTAVEHVPSGVLAGYTEYSVPKEPHRAAQQYGTLVLEEFRGHGLGMLVKLANLDHLAQELPECPCAQTFNAEENRHMLDVNEAIGFVPISYEGVWRLDLA